MNNYVKKFLSYSTQLLCAAESELLLLADMKLGPAAARPAEPWESKDLSWDRWGSAWEAVAWGAPAPPVPSTSWAPQARLQENSSLQGQAYTPPPAPNQISQERVRSHPVILGQSFFWLALYFQAAIFHYC